MRDPWLSKVGKFNRIGVPGAARRRGSWQGEPQIYYVAGAKISPIGKRYVEAGCRLHRTHADAMYYMRFAGEECDVYVVLRYCMEDYRPAAVFGQVTDNQISVRPHCAD